MTIGDKLREMVRTHETGDNLRRVLRAQWAIADALEAAQHVVCVESSGKAMDDLGDKLDAVEAALSEVKP